MGFSTSLLFLHGVPSIRKTDVAPVLAVARVGFIIIVCTCLERHCQVVEEFEVTTVFLSLSVMPTIDAATILFWVGCDKN